MTDDQDQQSDAALRRMEAVLLHLEPTTRAAFLAARLGGMSNAEIAAQLGLTIKQVERRMAKAIAALDRALNSHGK